MRAVDYQKAVTRTMKTQLTEEAAQANWSMGLCGETGEVVDYLKKHMFHGHDLDENKLIDELGDVLWYLTALCEQFDIGLDEVMERNIEKLRRRYPQGFDIQRSQDRREP